MALPLPSNTPTLYAGCGSDQILKPAAQKLGLPKIGWHTFRHSFKAWIASGATTLTIETRRSGVFEFYGDNVKVGLADVFQSVRGQGRSPEGTSGSGFRREAAAVQEHHPVTIAADEVAPTEQVIGARPLVFVQRDGLPGADTRVEHANRLIFEEQPVILWCGRQGVQVL